MADDNPATAQAPAQLSAPCIAACKSLLVANSPVAFLKYQVTKQLVVKSALWTSMGSKQSSFSDLMPQTVLLMFQE